MTFTELPREASFTGETKVINGLSCSVMTKEYNLNVLNPQTGKWGRKIKWVYCVNKDLCATIQAEHYDSWASMADPETTPYMKYTIDSLHEFDFALGGVFQLSDQCMFDDGRRI